MLLVSKSEIGYLANLKSNSDNFKRKYEETSARLDFEVRNNLSERDKLEKSLKGLELTLLSAKHEAIKQVLYDIYE